jgi:hypothetical protein
MKLISVAAALCLAVLAASAGVFDFLKKTSGSETSAVSSLSGFSQDQLADALKQALSKGVESAVTNLGRTDGFLGNPQVRIPMPDKLQAVERTLRGMKQDRLADEFVTTMNRAAEEAVPAALPIFTESLKSMTVEDSRQLLAGGQDSATQFFKQKGDTRIQERMLPVIKDATAKTGVTSAYKKLLDQAAGGSSFLGKLNINTASLDVDKYVTQKASDGLFKMIAEEEKRIRENPAARTTELLDKVFGAVAKGQTAPASK